MSMTNAVQSLTVQAPAGVIEVGPVETKLKPERVQEMLAAAPAWQLLGGTASLQREKHFPDATAALLYSSYVTSLADESQGACRRAASRLAGVGDPGECEEGLQTAH